jgi:hypothetical protein
MTDVEQQIRLVSEFQIQCVFVGGFAAFIHGASIRTHDLDVCYSRDKANLTKVVAGLRSVNALLRGAPEGIPFILDEETLARGVNFPFETNIGNFDLFGEVQGVGDFAECSRNSDEVEIFGTVHRVLSLDKLIAAKRSAGRPKDLLVLPELEALRKHQRKTESASTKTIDNQS